MPSAPLTRLRSKAIESLAVYLAREWGATVASEGEKLKLRYGSLDPRSRQLVHNPEARNLVACWELTLAIPHGRAERVWLCVDDRYPFSPPSVFVDPGAFFLRIPHVESSGRLCVLAETDAFSAADWCGVANYVLWQAAQLLGREVGESVLAEFGDEFESYWNYFCSEGRRTAVSILPHGFASDSCPVLAHGTALVFGASERQLQEWESRRWPGELRGAIEVAAVIEPPRPFIPSAYPSTLGEVRDLVNPESTRSFVQIVEQQARHLRTVHVLLRVRGEAGEAMGVCSYFPPRKLDGFRIGHPGVGRSVASAIYWRGRMELRGVQRADAASIEARTGQATAPISDRPVAIIGCGALGGDIAMLLARAGVRRLKLIDPDTFTWENLGRHLLGADSVGSNKATALQRHLGRALPHIEVEAIPSCWEDASNRLMDCQLVISLAASWRCEGALTAFNRRRSFPAIFGWAEPHGLGGHSVAVVERGGCLRCGMDDSGHFSGAVASLPDGGELHRVPRCGGGFIPHSLVDTLPVKHLIVQQALEVLLGNLDRSEHRVHVGGKHLFESTGASLLWRPQGLADGDEAHGRSFVLPWPRSAGCPICA